MAERSRAFVLERYDWDTLADRLERVWFDCLGMSVPGICRGRTVLRKSSMRPSERRIVWPGGKDFAFTVFDDTDLATIANVKPVYDLLADQGILTTKSVWPLRNAHGERRGEGTDCEDPEYLNGSSRLQAQGFEVGLHTVASGGNRRDRTIAGTERFLSLFGTDTDHLLHTFNQSRRDLFWAGLGSAASGVRSTSYTPGGTTRCGFAVISKAMSSSGATFANPASSMSGTSSSPISTLCRQCPEMPYHDPSKPYVNYWFASSEGQDVDELPRRPSRRPTRIYWPRRVGPASCTLTLRSGSIVGTSSIGGSSSSSAASPG